MEISNWFKGFEKGIARLSLEERSAFFSECGKNCVNGGTLSDMSLRLCSILFTPKCDLFAAQFVERQALHRNAFSFHLGWWDRLRNENRGR